MFLCAGSVTTAAADAAARHSIGLIVEDAPRSVADVGVVGEHFADALDAYLERLPSGEERRAAGAEGNTALSPLQRDALLRAAKENAWDPVTLFAVGKAFAAMQAKAGPSDRGAYTTPDEWMSLRSRAEDA